ncbi:MAG: patatin-like phospholipase family protein [Alphaproteobacteria bacterium]|nr:patatin-like phospholipase family protein [Alphaproteobacteria bacterium]
MPQKNKEIKTVNLALQGGGSHGAFSWGVIDRLLEEENIRIEGITGTSAGAMNAAALGCGIIKGGNEGGREAMTSFWKTLSDHSADSNPFKKLKNIIGSSNLDKSPLAILSNILSQILSPYQTNPLNKQPLRDIINKTIDLKILRKSKDIKVYVCATNVQTNEVKIFDNNELSEDALLASACLPALHHAVNCKGHYYWDGGFMGNPMLEPLIYKCMADDIIIIPINPTDRPALPKTAADILDRLNEITFNSTFIREIRSIVHMLKLFELTNVSIENPYTRLKLHKISNELFMANQDLSSKYNTDWDFLIKLRDAGRACADEWIKRNYYKIGKETTMDLSELQSSIKQIDQWYKEMKIKKNSSKI